MSYDGAIEVPSNLIAAPGGTVVNLSWDSVSDATGYNVKRAITVGGPYTTIAENITDNTYVDTSVIKGTTYYYVVTALGSSGESSNSNEASATPYASSLTLDISSVDKAKVGDEITATVEIHNADTICAEDIRLVYDADRLEYIGAESADGMKLYHESNLGNGIKRYIIASLGKANAANGDKALLKLKFKAKAVGEAKIDIVKGRIADNATLEADVDQENCGEKTILIEGGIDVNRTGEFTLLDLGIDAWYFGDAAASTDTEKYDADVVIDGTIDDLDLAEIVAQMLLNTNYPGNN